MKQCWNCETKLEPKNLSIIERKKLIGFRRQCQSCYATMNILWNGHDTELEQAILERKWNQATCSCDCYDDGKKE